MMTQNGTPVMKFQVTYSLNGTERTQPQPTRRKMTDFAVSEFKRGAEILGFEVWDTENREWVEDEDAQRTFETKTEKKAVSNGNSLYDERLALQRLGNTIVVLTRTSSQFDEETIHQIVSEFHSTLAEIHYTERTAGAKK